MFNKTVEQEFLPFYSFGSGNFNGIYNFSALNYNFDEIKLEHFDSAMRNVVQFKSKSNEFVCNLLDIDIVCKIIRQIHYENKFDLAIKI